MSIECDDCASATAYHTPDVCPARFPTTPEGFLAYCHALAAEEFRWVLEGRGPAGTDTRPPKEEEW